jgi:uncharacterized protein (TIGR02246 family)
MFGLALCLVAALAFTLIPGGGQVPAQPGPKGGENPPAPGKGKRAQEFIDAFNKGDAQALANFWVPEGDYTDEIGRHYKGRPAIEKMYEKYFAANKGGKLAITVTSHRMVTSDVALEEGITEVAQPDGGPPTSAAFSAVLVKKDGVWYFESVRDSLPQPPSNAEHFEDIDWLLGNWVGENEKGESGTASYSWAENKNFIVSNFSTTLNGIPVVGGTQWIVWDAVDKEIRSFSFYSGGGFGQAVWSKDGGKWLIKVLLAVPLDEDVALFEALTGKYLRTLKGLPLPPGRHAAGKLPRHQQEPDRASHRAAHEGSTHSRHPGTQGRH